MSTTTTPATPLTLDDPSITIIAQDGREEFDALVRELSGVATPIPQISEAVLSTDPATDQTAGVAYIAVRHVVSPYLLVEGCPPDTLGKLLDVIADQLRATVRETITAAHQPVGSTAGSTSTRGLSYDVYVPRGQQAPSGPEYELLPVEVWRRRVC